MTTLSRAQKLRQVQKPYFIATAVLIVTGTLAFFLGASGAVHRTGALLLALAPLIDAVRHRAAFPYHDEYGQSVILKAAAAGFAGVMGTMLGLWLLGVFVNDAPFSGGLMPGLFAGAYLGFLGVQKALYQKDAQQE